MANGYGNGSIIQLDKGKDGKKPKNKCRKWRLVVSLGRDPRGAGDDAAEQARAAAAAALAESGEDGEGAKPKKPKRRYRQKAMNFEGTYTEAQAALREFRERIENGEVVTKTKWTFDEYAKHYVDAREAAGEIEERTVKTLRATLRQLGHRIGALNMQDVTPQVLKQAYVDFEAGTIDVHSSCDDRGELKKTKTEAGNRILPMSPKLAASLMERKLAQAEDFAENAPDLVTEVKAKKGEYPAGTVEVAGKHYDLSPGLPVTADEFGRRCVPASLSTWWKNHSSDYGMDGWTLHELRHSFLSLAAASGVHPAIMQQLAGHSSAKTTMDIYTHVNMDSKRAAVMAMQDAFME